MIYTLSTWALWLVVAAVIGGVVGWLLRGLRGLRRPGLPVDAAVHDDAEQQLHDMAGDLHRLSADRDRLAGELASAKAALAGTATADEHHAVVAERDGLAALLAAQEVSVAELRVRLWNAEARAIEAKALLDAHTAGQPPPVPDVRAGAAVLGVPVVANDLTLVEGVGPKIAALCTERGITTWWTLANYDLDLLRKMLADAGPKFQVHDPTTWPHQARLLATGQWEKFKILADALRAERTAE